MCSSCKVAKLKASVGLMGRRAESLAVAAEDTSTTVHLLPFFVETSAMRLDVLALVAARGSGLAHAIS